MKPGAIGIRTVAVIEGFKGGLVLIVGMGFLRLIHHDAAHFGERLVAHLHLNPARHSPHVLIDAFAGLDDSRLRWLAAAALSYAAFRFAIAYGLWFRLRWAQWLSILSASIYIPFEIVELTHGITGLRIAMFLINVLIVAVMVHALRQRRQDTARV